MPEAPVIHRVKDIQEIKDLSQISQDFFISLNGGMRSTKNIYWNGKKFEVFNFIDNSEEKLTEKQIMNDKITNIGKSLKVGGLYWWIYKDQKGAFMLKIELADKPEVMSETTYYDFELIVKKGKKEYEVSATLIVMFDENTALPEYDLTIADSPIDFTEQELDEIEDFAKTQLP